ncbi:MAG: glycosyltransferase family 4 protein [Halioglobus sp.]|nr:glycosyltransferase family 4 protein [Halioglobus sp.]
MTSVTLLRDFAEDQRTSMERYADQLFTSLSTGASNTMALTQRQPQLGKITRKLPQAGNLRMRVARYVDYPWQARSIDSDLYHIIDHGYAHLMQVIDPGRTVITVHDVIPLLAGRGLVPGMRMRRQWLAEYSFSWLKRAARLIAVSESTRSDLIQHCGCDPDKIDVVYHGLGGEFAPLAGESADELRQSLGLPDTGKKLVLVTGSAHYKNHPTSLQVLRRLHEQHGDGIALVHLGGARPVWNSALAEAGYPHRVIELAGLNQQQLVRLYNAVDCLLFPSWYEGFGWPPLEAMACGTPVVTSGRASLPEIVGAAGTTFDPGDVEGMAACVEKLLFDPVYRQQQTSAGIEQAASFSWERNSREVVCTYDKLHP